MNLRLVKLLPTRWYIRHKGINGPSARLNEPAFWPSLKSPELIALDVNEPFAVYTLQKYNGDIDYVDKTLSATKAATDAFTD